MKIASLPFSPSKNQRLNELVGFLLLIVATLIFLALVSYSPDDPSLDTAVSQAFASPIHNWIGLAGAMGSDLALQPFGIAVFAVPIVIFMMGLRWFRSQKVPSPGAKIAGVVSLT